MSRTHTAIGAASTVEEHRALARARRKRTCPGAARLRAGGEAVVRHLEHCPGCREKFASLRTPVDFSDILPSPARREQAAPGDGQIRSVRDEAGERGVGEEKGLFFRPPLVVVIQVPSGAVDFVRVAQLHDEPELRGPGDIPLKLPGVERFAESWNTYPLLTRYLGPVLGNIPDAQVRKILAASRKPLPAPDGEEVLDAFRRLEIEVASHFCRLSVTEIMDMLEQGTGEAARPRRATIHQFRPPEYDGGVPPHEWLKKPGLAPSVAAGAGVSGLFGILPIIGAACFGGAAIGALVGAVGGDLSGKNAAGGASVTSGPVKKTPVQELKEKIEEYLGHTRWFNNTATDLHLKICGEMHFKRAETLASEIYRAAANARKAADAVQSLAAILTIQANNGEAAASDSEEATKSVENALALAETAMESARKTRHLLRHFQES